MPEQTRKLAAIMFTDIVGYSSMMGSDEDEALNMLRENRALHKDLIRKHNGELLKEMGDGVLAMFPAAYDSLQCALAIQKAVVLQAKYKLRIGIHLGDITIEEDDVFGDDVNIAARIESIADPGGIYISESIYKTIRRRGNQPVHDLGELHLKNISYPIRVYAVLGKDLPVPKPHEQLSGSRKNVLQRTGLWYAMAILVVVIIIAVWKFSPERNITTDLKEKQSVAVLPFANLSEDPEQEYIVDGLQDAIIGQLSKIHDLRVISRTSTLRYRKTDLSVPEIAEELKVDNILEASVLGTETLYRIQVQLVKAFPLESHVWSEEYDHNLDELMNMQGEVARSVAEALNVDAGTNSIVAEPINPEVYKLYLRGMHELEKGEEEDMLAGIKFLNEAVELDPTAAFAYAGLAQGYIILGHSPYTETEHFFKAKAAAIQALAIDEHQAEAYAALADVKMYYDWDYEGSGEAFAHAIRIKPSLAEAHAHYTWLHIVYDRWEEGIRHAELTVEIDPFSTIYTSWLAWLYWWAGYPDKAIETAKETLELNPNFSVGYMVLGSAYAEKGMFEDAIPALEKAVDLHPRWISHLTRALVLSGRKGEAEKVFNAVKDDPRLNNQHLAFTYASFENRDETLNLLKILIDERSRMAPWMYAAPHFRFLHNDPVFLEICRKANIPEEVLNPGQKKQSKQQATLTRIMQ